MNRTLTLAAAMLSVMACEKAGHLDARGHIVVNPVNPEVGEEVSVRLEGVPGALASDLLDTLRVEPDGIFERTAVGSYRAIAAGRAYFAMAATSEGAAVPDVAWVDVACPNDEGSGDIVHRDETISEDVTWDARQGSHRIEGTVRIDGATLTLGACTSISMGSGASLIVGESLGGRLLVRGSAEHPIRMFGSDWQGVRVFADRIAGSEIRYLELDGAAGFSDGEGAALDIVGDPTERFAWSSDWSLVGLTVTDCDDIGIRIRHHHVAANLSWRENSVSDCGGFPVSLDPESIGAAPSGDFSDNTRAKIQVIGGVSGPMGALFRDVGVPYQVQDSISFVTSWTFQYPRISDRLGGAEYTVIAQFEAGVRLEFERGGLYFGSGPPGGPPPGPHRVRVTTLGNQHRPAVFTSAASSPAPGDWVGLVLTQDAHVAFAIQGASGVFFSVLHGAIVEYAGAPSGLGSAAGTVWRAGIILDQEIDFNASTSTNLLDGATVRHSAGYGVLLAGSPSAKDSSVFTARRRGPSSCLCGNAWGPFATAGAEPCVTADDCGFGEDCVGESGRTVCAEAAIVCPCDDRGIWAW